MRAWGLGWLVVALLSGVSLCAAASPLPPNRLADHPSPYLALHGDDPVRWQPWNAQTVALAQRLGRPLFVSSGFFACHWCHVMQRESFRDGDIARLLNTAFVPVKIDREIDTALDDALFAFVREQAGIAGWPLNVILTPQAEPWHGFVYLPLDAFGAVLREHASRPLPAPMEAGVAEALGAPLDDTALRAAVRQALLQAADDFEGGFGSQAKFPFVPRLDVVLERFADDADLGEFFTLTVDAIVSRGLHDHIGGGFFRYTVDPGWEEPHFEKMLADNAQLARLLFDAAERFERPDWRAAGLATVQFMLREMRRADGLFISALSAVDGSGAEGGYYLWTPAQLGRALDAGQLREAVRIYGLARPPRFDGGHLPQPVDAVDVGQASPVRQRLLQVRAERDLPADDKAVIAWNALVLTALMRAAAHDERFESAADELAERLLALAGRDELPRALGRDGEAIGAALLEDYALLAAALAEWGRARDDGRFGHAARHLADAAWARFHDGQRWRAGSQLLLHQLSVSPLIEAGHLPSPTATLYALAREFGWHARADDMAALARRWIALAPLERAAQLP
jgi:uncharacterized protein YyaL (SSP411 family)